MAKKNLILYIKNKPVIYGWLFYTRAKIYSEVPSKLLINFQWITKFNKTLDSNDPATYNEKLQWEKINSDSPLARKCADKIEVREYVAKCIGEAYLNDLLGVYDNVSSVDFSSLPDKFVLKGSHDSGSTIVVKDKRNISPYKLRNLNRSLKLNYGRLSKEWVYSEIKPKLVVERLLEDENKPSLDDYKVYCFNGRARIVQVDLGRFDEDGKLGDHKRNFYDLQWNKVDLELIYSNAERDVPKPVVLQEMLDLSEKLARPFNHVRIDWYVHDGKLIFGEMTFFPESGFGKFNKDEWARRLGGWFEVSGDLSY